MAIGERPGASGDGTNVGTAQDEYPEAIMCDDHWENISMRRLSYVLFLLSEKIVIVPVVGEKI